MLGKYYYHKTAADFLTYASSNINNMVAYESLSKQLEKAKIDNSLQGNATSLPVLLYHGIKENNEKLEDEDVSIDEFRDQMFTLKKLGYQTVTLRDYLNFLNGRKELPEKSFLLTFDDGRKDSYYKSDSILKALNYNAVMFVITSHSIGDNKSPYYLNQSELEKMLDTGRWQLESHGKYDHNPIQISPDGKMGHFMTNKEWLVNKGRYETDDEYKKRIYDDMNQSKNDLEKALNIKVETYAFPFGDFSNDPKISDTVLETVKSVYEHSFIQFRPDERTGYYRNNYQSEKNLDLLRRLEITHKTTADNLVSDLVAGVEKPLPFDDEFNSDKGNWISSSPNIPYQILNGKITIKTIEKVHSSSVFLDGSYNWKNYELFAIAKLTEGTNFGILARAIDGRNLYYCAFRKDSVKVDEHYEGKRYLLSDTKSGFKFDPSESNNVGMIVDGNNIQCLVDGKVVAESKVPIGTIEQGGIGFSVISVDDKESALEVDRVEVKQL